MNLVVSLVVALVLLPGIGIGGELSDAAGMGRYRRLVAAHPGKAAYWNALGYYCLKADRQEEAERYFLKAIDLDESFAIAHNNLGVLYLHQGKPVQAEVHFARAVEIDKDYAKAQYNLAVCLFRQKRYSAAARAYLKARVMDRSYVEERDDPEKMKKALAEATKDARASEEIRRMRQWFAPAY